MTWYISVGIILLSLGIWDLIKLASTNPLLACLLTIVIGLIFIFGIELGLRR